ncbi:MAG: TIGR02147 family protein [SAR324 cluster bacterium]|nr:TIGR02147 family protein [SAR324 cluster bacterium]
MNSLKYEDLNLDIYQYQDCRSLLKDYFEKCQELDKRYSFRYFSKTLGLSSPGYIQAMLQGKKPVSDRLMENMIHLLGLKKETRAYFEMLVRLDRVDFNSPLYQEYYQAIQTIRSKHLQVKSLDEAQYNCISSWYHWVIREMAMMQGASLKVQWLKRCLNRFVPITGKQIMRIVEDLKEARLLEETDGSLVVKDPVVNLGDETSAMMLKRYHMGAMEQGILSLNNKAKDRDYGSVLVATNPEKIQLAREKLRKTRREIMEILQASPEEASLVVSWSYQFFPVAELVENADE